MSNQLLDGLDVHPDYEPDLPRFQAFPKIPRFKRNYVISEKIDGTNACVIIAPDGAVLAQSRTRLVTPESDNFGFALWVKENEDDLRGLGEGYHFGEWWGGKIQRGYGLKEKRFSLFNTSRWTLTFGDEDEKRTPPPECCHVVPLLHEGNGKLDYAIEWCLDHLREQGSAASPGFMQPEGIVVYHSASRGYYKVMLEGDDTPKSKE